MRDVRILDVGIEAPAERVYAFVAEPRNLPRWAPNFGHEITPAGDHWIMHTAEGPVPVRFAPRNEMGVLDHWVRLPGGEIHNPMRVVANGAGSVLTFHPLSAGRVDGRAVRRRRRAGGRRPGDAQGADRGSRIPIYNDR
jgi:hypothetical protein